MPTLSPVNSLEDVYDWLRSQAERLGLRVALLTDEARLQNGWLYLPTHVEGVSDPYDNALKLQHLEDTWNDRQPRPEPPLFLVPAEDPLRQAAYERVTDALRRKLEAVDAFGRATSREEQERAAAEFQQAERAEDEGHRG